MTVLRTLRLAAAAALTAAALAVLPAGPASAATCSSASGVSVVVDFSLLGGGVAATCVADGGGDTAGALFEVDHDLTRVSQFPGAVCKVDGTPADAQCERMPPTDAYWGLFWSDGSGGWVYSSEGVDSLNIPDGGSVAFAWQDGGDRDQPGVAPPQHASEEPSPSPSPGGDGGDNGGTGGSDQGHQPGGQTPATPAATGAPTGPAPAGEAPSQGQDATGEKGEKGDRGDRADRRDRDGKDRADGREEDVSPAPEDDPSDAVPDAAEPAAGDDDDRLPAWVAPTGIAALFGVAGVIALLRRRSTLG